MVSFFSLFISLPYIFFRFTLWERSSFWTPSVLLFPFLSPCWFALCSLSLFPPPLPSPSHTVVCRHAGISGPQNDRPNLSALAPVTKDGRPGSVCACDWCTFELLTMWLVSARLSTAPVFLAVLCIPVFVCVRYSPMCCLWLPRDCNSSYLKLLCMVLDLETHVFLHAAVCVLVCVKMRGVSLHRA